MAAGEISDLIRARLERLTVIRAESAPPGSLVDTLEKLILGLP
jgi:hypothetical protein